MHERSEILDTNVEQGLARIFEVVAAGVGSWCNFQFTLDADYEPPTESALFGFLMARGPANPVGTFSRTSERVELGIHHGAGVRTRSQLNDANIELPEGWTVLQDHPRRGFVVAGEIVDDAYSIAHFAVAAIDYLTIAECGDELVVDVYEK